jgi:RND superfamily putative drug exporter
MCARRRFVIAAWIVLVAIAAPLALSLTGALSGAGWEAQGSTATRVRDELRSDFAALGTEAAMVVYRQDAPLSGDTTGLDRLVAELQAAPGAKSVMDPTKLPPEAGLFSPDGHTVLIPVDLRAAEDADRPESAAALMAYVQGLRFDTGTRAEVTGEWPVWADFNRANEEALHKAELLSGLPSVVLLVLAFGTLVAAGIPLILALAGIAVGFAALHLVSALTPMSVWSMNFSMMIGLAVGIDYSLFIISRYREERAGGLATMDALATTLRTAGKAVFLSALTVVISLGAIFLVPVMVFRSMALGMILSVVAVAAASLTLLPALLAVLGDRVLVKKNHEDPDVHAETRWARITNAVVGRPKLSLVAGLVILLLFAAPALGMRLGMPGGEVVDKGNTSRDGYDMVAQSFGSGATAPVYVTVDASHAQQVVELAKDVDGVVDARVVAPPAASGRVVVRVTGDSDVAKAETMDRVGELRARIQGPVDGALVGGPAAGNYDLTKVLTSRAPVAIALILLVAFGLLLLVFRSLVIALTSVATTLLTVAASFGFATLVFQHGVGASLLGIESQGFIDAWAPLFFFAILFGIAMDYQLFLLAAVRERYELHGDTTAAVRDGMAITGRPITNAALIMIVVFLAFGVTGPIPPTELGITLALAVALFATVVRVLVIPATMTLLGRHNWYLPKVLERLPKVSFTH